MTTQLQTELQGLTCSQLRELCRKDAKLFAGHSYFTNKAALLRFMRDRIRKSVKEQASQPPAPAPEPTPAAAPTGDAPGRKSKQAYSKQELEGMRYEDLMVIVKGNPMFRGYHWHHNCKTTLIEFILNVQENGPQETRLSHSAKLPKKLNPKKTYTRQELEDANALDVYHYVVGNLRYKGYCQLSNTKKTTLIEFIKRVDDGIVGDELFIEDEVPVAAPKPAVIKPIVADAEEYLDDVAARAVYWKGQMLQTLNWGRWQFGEAQGRDKYLSILHIPSSRHWVILWEWRSFEAACQEMIKAISRYGEAFRVDDFIPSPGYLPAPACPDEEPPNDDDPGDCQNCAGTGEDDEGHECPMCGGDGVADSGEGDQHPGGSRREPSLVGV